MDLKLCIIILVLTIVISAQGKDSCLGTDNGMTIVEDTPARKIQALRNRYEGCQYVYGNLEITGLDTEEFYNTDLSFLNAIREVSGYVLIANVYVQTFTLSSLSIIRGDNLYQPVTTNFLSNAQSNGYALYVAYNCNNDSTVGMRILSLNKLTDISNGDVMFENNHLLGYATTNINWREIFADSVRQKTSVLHDVTDQTICSRQECDNSCDSSVVSDSANGTITIESCWGPGPENCQKMTQIGCSEQCEARRCFGGAANQCCHPQCAGRCTGPTNSDCMGCRYFDNEGSCEPFCPLPMIYNNSNSRWIKNPDRKFAFGKLCLASCPVNFLEYAGGCVSRCPQGFEAKKTTCVLCGAVCQKICEIKWDKSIDFLHSNNMHELEGCTTIDGHLKIVDASLRGDPFNDISPMNVSELQKLLSVKEITEYLMIQNLNGFNVTNFSFLSNLESILGRKTDSYGSALNVISNSDVEFLGFSSLRGIYAGHAIIESNPKLCYLDGLRWQKVYKGTTKQKRFLRMNANNTSDCVPEKHVCHKECMNGCWGPTAKMCINCQNYRDKKECVSSCGTELVMTKTKKCNN